MIDSTARADTAQPAGPSNADLEFLQRIECCTLPEYDWTHEAHIRIAWICLSLHEFENGLERIRKGILRYNTRVLKQRHKYHETVTVAFAILVASQMTADEPWADFVARAADLTSSDNPVLLKYYSEQQLLSTAARMRFIAPDRAPLPSIDTR